MAVIQGNFYISDESMRRIKVGEYIRNGGVVRDKSGHIVEYLKDAPANSINKYVLVGVGCFVAESLTIAGINILINKYKKYQEKKKLNDISNLEQEFINNHNLIIDNYLDSISSSTLDIETINKTIMTLRFINEQAKNNNLKIKIDIQKTNELAYVIYNYTISFAKLNNFDLKLDNDLRLENTIKCLEYQKQIFETSDLEKEELYIEVK